MTDSDAIVVRLDGDHAWVDVQAGCDNCSATGCGLGSGKGRAQQKVLNLVGARAGDHVSLSVPEGAVLRAAFFCYVLPVMLVLVGAAFGMAVADNPGSIGGALFGLFAGWSGMRIAGRREPELRMTLKSAVVQLHRNPQT
jgi:sigma-E factor negative regulatory protein RseC